MPKVGIGVCPYIARDQFIDQRNDFSRTAAQAGQLGNYQGIHVSKRLQNLLDTSLPAALARGDGVNRIILRGEFIQLCGSVSWLPRFSHDALEALNKPKRGFSCAQKWGVPSHCIIRFLPPNQLIYTLGLQNEGMKAMIDVDSLPGHTSDREERMTPFGRPVHMTEKRHASICGISSFLLFAWLCRRAPFCGQSSHIPGRSQ